jgi:hypothetical protein
VTGLVQLLHETNVLGDGWTGGVVARNSRDSNEGHVQVEAEPTLLQRSGHAVIILLQSSEELLQLLWGTDDSKVLLLERQANEGNTALNHHRDDL